MAQRTHEFHPHGVGAQGRDVLAGHQTGNDSCAGWRAGLQHRMA
jgi:hypothetical protein